MIARNKDKGGEAAPAAATESVTSTSYKVATIFTRVFILINALLSVATVDEAMKIRDESKDATSFEVREDGVLYVPLLMCLPSEISIKNSNGTIIEEIQMFDSNSSTATAKIDNCLSLESLIGGIALSLLFSTLASVAYLGIILTAAIQEWCRTKPTNGKKGCCSKRREKRAEGKAVKQKAGRFFSEASLTSMALFLVFILIQAASSAHALHEQVGFVVDFYEKFMDDEKYPDIESYAPQSIFTASFALNLVTAILISLNFLQYQLCSKPRKPRATKKAGAPGVAAKDDDSFM